MNDGTSGKNPPSTDSTRPLDPQPTTPQRIGRYRILHKIGEGGMGEVYLAEQLDPRRNVALKIIKWGMDTKQVMARFEAERQALALMDHANIAKVFDAGATQHGRPYFVMEHVKGVPITEHCDRHRLNTVERLQLFIQVCDGVQHAHQKAVIHRDIKPSNVLVSLRDGAAVPKIIDFGVAKATAQRLTAQTMVTGLGVMVGTPEYMSPEQADLTGQDIDTRTDVYSLGVLLYELLIGALPFDPSELREAGFDEIRRRIREEEPAKPSTRLNTLGSERSSQSAQRRRTDVPALQRQLKGDLDWITMRALEKDRARRHVSPAALAEDIQRHLRHEPVLASPPSAAYRARKFVRRHRVGVGVGVAALLVLVAFAATLWVQAGRIARERDRANREAAAAKQTSVFLESLFEVSDPDEARGSTVTARELLDQSAERIRSGEIEQVDVRASLLGTMGNVYRKLGLYESAEPLLTESLSLRRSSLGDDDSATTVSLSNLGELYRSQGRYAEAEPLFLEALDTRKRVLGDDHPDTIAAVSNVAILYDLQGRQSEAEPLFVQALESRGRVLGDEHPDTLASMNNLATMYDFQGRYDEAEALYRETLEIRNRVLGDDHPATLRSMNNLANMYKRQGRLAEAEPLYLVALETRKRVLGDNHPDTLGSMNNLAILRARQGRYAEAEPLFLEVLEIRKRVLPSDHPDTLKSINNLAILFSRQGRYAEAEPFLLEALDARKRSLGDDHPDTIASMNSLADFYGAQGRYTEAEALYLETLETLRRVHATEHPVTLLSLNNLANLYNSQGRYAEAEPLYLEALETQRRMLGDGHPDTIASMHNLGVLYRIQARYAEAEPLLLEALRTRRRELGDEHPHTLSSMNNLVLLYRGQGRAAEARPLVVELLSLRRARAAGAGADATAKNEYAWLALTCEPTDLQDPPAALRFAEEANEMTEFGNAGYLDTLALAYFRTGRFPEAIQTEQRALELLPEEQTRTRVELQQRLAEFKAALK